MDVPTLLKKYNTAGPRYTSYPTVPHWENGNYSASKWLEAVIHNYSLSSSNGISLYIHLPYCESLCTYCGCNTRITKNHGVELPYIEALIKEWVMYCKLLGEKPKIRELHLGGGTPTFFNPEHLNKLLQAILGDNNSQALCSFEGHPDNTTIRHLQVLYQMGFKRMSLGIQDFDPKVQMMINRFQTPEQVFRILTDARALGYTSINFDLIYGLPGQTLGGLAQTMAEVLQMRPERIAFYGYAHVPWLKPGQRHYADKDIPQGDEKFALYALGRNLLLKAGYQEIGMDHFALKTDSLYKAVENRQLHRNFMGYTDQPTEVLLGLGVSAISDCQTAFSQNSKTVEAYLEKINNGQFPIEKGHILSENDKSIRKHILNIMCKGVTRFVGDIPLPVLLRLEPLIADHLVEIQDKEVRVLSEGKPFLRNVCMAFDEHLAKGQSQKTVFSQTI